MHDSIILAVVIRDSSWEKGLNFVSFEEDFQQVGFWGYDKGKKLNPHIHLTKQRSVTRTQEVLFVKQGSVRADIYTEKEELLTHVELHKGDVIILLKGGHGYEILEDDTKVLEIKNGPYLGPAEDRRVISS
jgi:hypothetical protein